MADDAPDTPPADAGPEATGRVTRSVELPAAADEVWSAITDPGLRAHWLDDDDARARTVRFDEVDAGRRVVWTWWRPDDEPGASTVEIVLAPTTGGTRVVVTETLPATPPGPPRGSARVRVPRAAWASDGAVVVAADPAHAATIRCVRAWSYRLLGLELLLVDAVGAWVR